MEQSVLCEVPSLPQAFFVTFGSYYVYNLVLTYSGIVGNNSYGVLEDHRPTLSGDQNWVKKEEGVDAGALQLLTAAFSVWDGMKWGLVLPWVLGV